MFFLLSCGSKQVPLDNAVVAKVYNNTLTTNELKQAISLSPDFGDSAFAKNYVKQWAIDQLLYKQAQKQFGSDASIDEMVENYRNLLILNKYKQYLLDNKGNEPTNEAILNYYNANSTLFQLQEPVLKGAFISVVKKSPQIIILKDAIKKLDKNSIDRIETYSLKNPINYSVFNENWVKLSDISYLLPKNMLDEIGDFTANKYYEYQDSVFIYMLKVTDYQGIGSVMPLAMVRDKIKIALKEQNNKEFYKNFANELLEKEQKKGNVVIKL